ncbi:MAG: C4-type zinc ribbon domain-containing protein [Anaerolineae bacterium]|jgi:predicted  nucleic acid-binding Zn-ribbon protein|nr:C4-type zinc ribbon domain-containing protein [Anaerolineae bacterium]MDH7473234.1 C4-type zinc ribbon domain-containing protein [Anaerolineae bacterium]
MHRAEQLYNLQCTDSEFDKLARRLREVEASLGETEELRQVRLDLQKAEQALNRQQIRLRDLELENASLADKLAANEQRLYGGTVRNPKELAGLQEENTSLRQRKNQLEDVILEVMIEVEEAQERVRCARDRLTQVEKQWRAEQERLTTERGELQAHLCALDARRRELRAVMPPDELKIYDDLRRRKGGRAVVLLKEGVCQGCQVSLPSSEAQQARQGEVLVFCGSCGRILYAH